MSPETQLSEALRYQVNQLGNLVGGLELIANYLCKHPSSRGARSLARDVREILSLLPTERRPPKLLAELRTVMPADFREDPKSSNTETSTNTVLLPLVDQRRPASGLVRELWLQAAVPYANSTVFPAEADLTFRDALTNGCKAAQDLLDEIGIVAVQQIPDDFQFHIEHAPFGSNPRLEEESGWLAAALSYASLASGLTLDGVIAATGYIMPSGQIGNLDHVEEKITACLRERPDVRKILILSADPLPNRYQNDPRIARVQSLNAAFVEAWSESWPQEVCPRKLSVHTALDRAMYAYAKEHDLLGALTRFTALRKYLDKNESLSDRYRFLCDWRIACCHTHLRNPEYAKPLFERWADKAEPMWEQGIIDSENYADFFASYGTYLRHLGDIDEGIGLLERILQQAVAYRTPRSQQARLEASLGLLLIAKEDFPAAEQYLKRAYDLVDGEDKPKKCVHLARLYIGWGRTEEAWRYMDEAYNLIDYLLLPRQQEMTAAIHACWKSQLPSEGG